MSFRKIFFVLFIFCFIIFYYFYFNIYSRETQKVEEINFEVKQNETVLEFSERLETENIISDAWFFRKFLVWKKLDKKVKYGQYVVGSPITVANIVEALGQPNFNEKEVTVLPGSTVRDIANYFEYYEMFQAEEITELIGLSTVDYRQEKNLPKPTNIYKKYKVLQDKPWYVSYDGYLAPETIRVYEDADLEDILEKFISHRDSQFTEKMYEDIEKSGRTVHEILTMASILEWEVKTFEDKKIVSDLFWRRYDENWALQADSTVHYLSGKSGSVWTTAEDRTIESLWNTYKYPGLPLSPICNPNLDSIMAAIYPIKSSYNYFLTDGSGKVHYAVTNDEHNQNRYNYL